MSNMKTSIDGMIFIAGLEGICLTKYLCSSNVWTIGVGATKTEVPDIASWPMNKEITIEQAFKLFEKSLKRYENAVNRGLKVEVEQHVFDALVSWCYNVGTGWVSKATVIKLINNGTTNKSMLYNALMRYSKPKAIIGRRKKEAKLLTEAKYAGKGKANLFPVNSRGKPIYSRGVSIKVKDYLTIKEEIKPREEAHKSPQEDVKEKKGLFAKVKSFLKLDRPPRI